MVVLKNLVVDDSKNVANPTDNATAHEMLTATAWPHVFQTLDHY